MSEENKKSCSNCAFVHKFVERYYCRRYPPKSSGLDVMGRLGLEDLRVEGKYWCGEYKAKEEKE